jgi:superfamily II DNA or RNA helicase
MNKKNKSEPVNAAPQGFTLHYDRGTLLLEFCPGQMLPEVFKSIDISYDPRVFQWRCAAIHYREIKKISQEANIPFNDEVSNWCVVPWPNPKLPVLRDNQKKAIKAWWETRQGVIIMPTGTGKTLVALAIMKELGVSTLVVAPVRDLMYQWQRRIQHGLGYDAGIIGDNTFDLRPVSCTTYKSAYIHMDKLGHLFGLIIFDECHHLPGLNMSEAAYMSAAPFRMGLTATPERSDGRHKLLEELIGPSVVDIPLSKVKGEVLADYEITRVPVHLTDEERIRYNEAGIIISRFMQERSKTYGDYSWEDMMKEVGSSPEARAAQQAFNLRKSIEERAANKLRLLEDIFDLHQNEPVIVFTGSNAMARDVSLRFLIPCLLNHCGKRERHDILDGFEGGRYKALVANQVLDEGVDLPEAKIAVVLGGQTSTRQAKQRLGRILRKSGNRQGRLYEVVCEDTGEVNRSRKRRRTDAYKGTRHSKIKR